MSHTVNILSSLAKLARKQAIPVLFTTIVGGLFMMTSGQTARASSVELDHVDGLIGTNQLPAGVPITFHFKFVNNSGNYIVAVQDGIRLWTPNGATWSTPVGTWLPSIKTNYLDYNVYVNQCNVDGAGADTLGFSGLKSAMPGFPNGFNSEVFTITTTFPTSSIGKTFRIDSSYFCPTMSWYWLTPSLGQVHPSWPGPYSFLIVVNCAGNGDVNCDNHKNVADVVYMINYVFKQGPAPCTCQ